MSIWSSPCLKHRSSHLKDMCHRQEVAPAMMKQSGSAARIAGTASLTRATYWSANASELWSPGPFQNSFTLGSFQSSQRTLRPLKCRTASAANRA